MLGRYRRGVTARDGGRDAQDPAHPCRRCPVPVLALLAAPGVEAPGHVLCGLVPAAPAWCPTSMVIKAELPWSSAVLRCTLCWKPFLTPCRGRDLSGDTQTWPSPRILEVLVGGSRTGLLLLSSGLPWISLSKLWKPPRLESCWPFPVLELIKKLFLMPELNLPSCSSWLWLLAVSPGHTKVCLALPSFQLPWSNWRLELNLPSPSLCQTQLS